ncbi:TPR-like protein [Xylaria palmicola]|nr:TPR-like protein [Xylaria palmicola]
MEALTETFTRLLHQYNPQSPLWEITSREDLFKHLAQSKSNFIGQSTYSIRIDGALKSLDGFLKLVRASGGVARDENCRWEAMVWGSSALILAQLYQRKAGHEQILTLYEDLTITTALPCVVRQNNSQQYSSFVLQLFAELTIRLLKLALTLQTYPQAPQQKHNKFVEFEAEHMRAIQRIKIWADRLTGSLSIHEPPASLGPSATPLSSEKIPVRVNKYFHGRHEDLNHLCSELQSGLERPVVVCVYGLPGIGKTQLVAQYCTTFEAKYFACLWISADNFTKIQNGLSDCAVKMQLEGTSMTSDPRNNAQAMISWLQTTDRSWLVVFDNVDDSRHLEDFWPSGGTGHIIMTSRSPYIAQFRGSRPLPLSPLSQDDSKQLFYNIVGWNKCQQNAQEIDEILSEWKGVPLALYHIGSYISRLHIDVKRFINLYKRSAAGLYQSKGFAEEYPHSIATAFSVGQLEGDMKSLLEILCYLDPDGIPTQLLLSNFDYREPVLQIDSELGFYDALAGLCSSGLVSQKDDNLVVHRLVQSVAVSSMARDNQISLFNQVLSLLNREFPREIEGKPVWSEWDRCNSYLPHVLFIRRKWQELFKNDQKNAELANLLTSCTWYMVERGLFTEAEPLLMTARSACPDSEGALLTLAGVLFNLAGVRFECNRIKESLKLCQQVLQIRERILGPADPLLGNTLYSIGIVYMEDGQLEKALQCCLEAVKIHETCEKDGKHDGSPTGLSCLDAGLCYWKIGELELASRYIERGLDLFERTTGKLSQKYGQGLSYLVLVREAQNRLVEAKAACKESLEICQAITPNEFKTGLGLHKMANFLHREGKFEEALENIEKALPILQKTFDPAPRVARSIFKMSEILKDMGKEDEGAVKRREAERLRSTITTFPFSSDITEYAFNTLVPSFLC